MESEIIIIALLQATKNYGRSAVGSGHVTPQLVSLQRRVVNETYDAETEMRPRLRSDETETLE